MERLKQCAVIAFLLALVALALAAARYVQTLEEVTRELPVRVEMALAREGDETRRVLDKRLESIELRVDRQLSATRADATTQLDALRLVADEHLTRLRLDSLAIADRRLGEVTATVAGVREDIQPTVFYVNRMTPALVDNALGTIAATKVSMGAVAQMTRDLRLATPEMLTSLDRIARNSDRTTDATARAMNNFAELSRPLPRWVRVPLQILVPISPWAISLMR